MTYVQERCFQDYRDTLAFLDLLYFQLQRILPGCDAIDENDEVEKDDCHLYQDIGQLLASRKCFQRISVDKSIDVDRLWNAKCIN